MTDRGIIPLGTIMPFWGSDLPDGWVWCDGVPHGGPEELTAMIGPNSPDLRDREVDNARFLLRVRNP